MNPFVGEIRIFPINFAPSGWARCEGQILPISQNTALFSLLGTMYGGDGKSTFALPNLQGRVPIGMGQGQGLSLRDQGETGGEEFVSLIVTEIPAHNHAVQHGIGSDKTESPNNAAWTTTNLRRSGVAYGDTTNFTSMSANAVNVTGGSLPHNNMQPYLVLGYYIALQGVYPPRS